MRQSRLAHKVHLQEFGFREVPSQVLAMVACQDLDLQGNNLAKIPDELCYAMPSLTRLSLRRNQLVSPLPLKLGLLTALTTLDLAGNKLDSLPVGIAVLTRLRTLGFAGNPIQLPATALLSTDMAVIRDALGPVAAAGVGMNSTVYIASVHGEDAEGQHRKKLDGPSAAPFARPPGDPVVLVQDGVRRGLPSVQAAVEEAREGSLILLRPGVHKGPVLLRHPGVTLGGDGPCSECIIQAGADKDPDSLAAGRYATLVCLAKNTKVYNLTIKWDGAPIATGAPGSNGVPQGTTAVSVAAGFLSLVNCDLVNPQGNGVLVRRQGRRAHHRQPHRGQRGGGRVPRDAGRRPDQV